MGRKTVRKKIDSNRFRDYHYVAENFFGGAEVAADFEYWNAAGVLIVHSAIMPMLCVLNMPV